MMGINNNTNAIYIGFYMEKASVKHRICVDVYYRKIIDIYIYIYSINIIYELNKNTLERIQV